MTIQSLSWAARAPALLLGLREGLEAALILGIVLGLLRRTGNGAYARFVWVGAAAAGALSLSVAAGLLTWMIFWMQRQGRAMRSNLEGEIRRALTQSQRWGLAGLAFGAVAREGLELALFLTAAALSTSQGLVALGGLAGVLGAALLGWGLYASTARLDVRRFFDVSGALLLLFAAGLVAHGVHEFNDVGWIPAVVEPLWNVNGVLDENGPLGAVLKALFGYNGNPSLSEVLSYSFYLAIAAGLLLRGRVHPRPAAPTAAVEGA